MGHSSNLGWMETDDMDMVLVGFSGHEMAQLKNLYQLVFFIKAFMYLLSFEEEKSQAKGKASIS